MCLTNGVHINPASLPSGSTYADTRNLFINNYGSLGQAQRETTDTGIQFMGARGYNPITGQFLTPDPVRGGNETPYNYPNNPVNETDTRGLASIKTELVNLAISIFAAAFVGGICALTMGLGCLVTGIVVGAVSGLITGANEANEMGLVGSERSNYLLISAGIGALGAGSTSLIVSGTKKIITRAPTVIRSLLPKNKIAKEALELGYGVGVDKLSSKFVYEPLFLNRYSILGKR